MIWYVPHIHFIILCYVLLSLTDYQIWSIIYLVSTNSKKRAHNDKSIHDEAVPRSALQLSADSDNRYSGWYGNRPDFTGCYKARCCCIRLENELFFRYECAGCKLRRLYSTFILLQCGFIGCFQARIKDRESTRILQNSINIHGLRPWKYAILTVVCLC